MKCTNCNADLEGGAKFCTLCGQPVPEGVVPEDPILLADTAKNALTATGGFFKKLGGKIKDLAIKVWGKTKEGALKGDAALTGKLGDKKMYVYAGFIGLIGIIIIIAAIAGIVPNDNGYLTLENESILLENDETVYVVADGKITEIKNSPESVGNEKTSIDGKVTVFKSEDVLYLLKGKKAVELAEDVSSFELSLYGDYVVYTVSDTLSTTYYHCKVANGKTVEIFESDLESMLLSYTMSPDGKSVAYVASDGLDDAELYFFNGKKSTKVADCNGTVLGLTDNGKFIYATEVSESGKCNLYSFNKKGKETKIDSCDYSASFAFNLDATEIMFTSNGKTFVSRNAKEPVKVAGAEISLLSPVSAASAYRGSVSSVSVYPIETLFGHVYSSGSNAYLVNKKENKCIKLAKGSNFCLDESAEYLYYMDKDELKVLKIAKGEKAEDKAKVIADEIVFYLVTSDRKLVYYADEDFELYAVNGKKGGKAKKISSDALADAPVLDRNDVIYYIDEDNTVYAAKGKKPGKKLMEAVEYTELGGYVYIVDEDQNLFVAKGKSKPKKLMTLED